MMGLPKIIRKDKPIETPKQEIKEPVVMTPEKQEEQIIQGEQPQENTLDDVLRNFDERISNIEKLLIKLTSEK